MVEKNCNCRAGSKPFEERPFFENTKKAIDLCTKFNSLSLGSKERREIAEDLFGSCGKNVYIKPPFYCDFGSKIEIGQNVFININCIFLDGTEVPTKIEDDVWIGPKVTICTATHPLDPIERISGKYIEEPVTIGKRAWIGAGATILPGVSIGENTVVGAGSVVTKSLPANVVAAGNPAKIIRKIK